MMTPFGATDTLPLQPKLLGSDLRALISPLQTMVLTDTAFASRVEQIFQNAMLNLPTKITRVLEEYTNRRRN